MSRVNIVCNEEPNDCNPAHGDACYACCRGATTRRPPDDVTGNAYTDAAPSLLTVGGASEVTVTSPPAMLNARRTYFEPQPTRKELGSTPVRRRHAATSGAPQGS